jgi:signal transduction histidine kinase/ActR/RegA family two-component response regulator
MALGSAIAIGLAGLRASRFGRDSLSAVFNGVPAALAKFDANAKLVLWNQPYADFLGRFGLSPKPGLPREEIVRSTVGDAVYKSVAEQRSHNPTWAGRGGSVEWPTLDGGWIRAEIRSLAGGASLTIITDITAAKLAASQIADERDREKAANRAKSEFLANMSHEIRTPLNGVLGMVQIMERSALNEQQRERLQVIKRSGATLLSILNDILDVSKIEAGKMEISLIDFDLVQLGRDCANAFEGAAIGKDLRLLYHAADDLRGVWHGDALRIRQVVSNLVANAVKFTDDGEVNLDVSACRGGVVFAVSDTGIGIDAAAIERLFDKFVQADGTTTRRYGGTGLGLAICRDLAQLMGGEIRVESVPGRGSRFDFILPLTKVSDAASALGDAGYPALPATAAPLRILAAEDNLTNQLVLSAMLEVLGADITIAEDGEKAIAAFRSSVFDVILMDVQMPVMDGVDATRAIRRIERQECRRPTPIIGLTANTMQHQVDSYREAGMDYTLPKPVQIDDLYLVLEQATAVGEETKPAVA